MKRSVSERNRNKKLSKPEEQLARKTNGEVKNHDVKEEKAIAGLESSNSASEPEEENESEAEKEEDSDEEEIRLLFEKKVAARNEERKAGKNKGKSEKRGATSSSKSGEKKRDEGKRKEVVREEEEESEDERKSRKEGKKLKKKKKVVEEEEDDSEKGDGSECRFPMRRMYKIMKDQNCSSKIAQEAIFLANKASEKFLELYTKEAYACAFLDHKNHLAYDHLASVVSKRKRFDFLSDIVPEKVKAEDAFAERSVAEK